MCAHAAVYKRQAIVLKSVFWLMRQIINCTYLQNGGFKWVYTGNLIITTYLPKIVQ